MKNTCKFKPAVSHAGGAAWGNTGLNWTPDTGDNGTAGGTETGGGNSGKFDVNNLVNTIGNVAGGILDLFKKPDATNNYYIDPNTTEKKDNTMLYVGIGGVILVVILFAIVALKK